MNSMVRRYLTVSTLIGFIVFIIILYIPRPTDNLKLQIYLRKANHKPAGITNQRLPILANSIDIEDFRSILKPILVERVVGTRGHTNVRNFIIEELRKLNWNIEQDSFLATTPNKGRLRFTNIVATPNVDSPRYLVLACHYDSKLSNFVFIGATDSAVPCAMLLYLAKSMNNTLQQLQSSVNLKLIFFDGEEAFVSWSAKDSLYGSRHLARVLESRTYAVDSENAINDLNKMDLLVLLDLLGSSSPSFYSYFPDTHKWYKLLVSIEKNLNLLGLLQSDTDYPVYQSYFNDQILYGAQIDDDHKPFLRKGVPCLHIIPTPFPEVWHTEDDNETAINMKTVKNLLTIFHIFIVQYLNGSSEV